MDVEEAARSLDEHVATPSIGTTGTEEAEQPHLTSSLVLGLKS